MVSSLFLSGDYIENILFKNDNCSIFVIKKCLRHPIILWKIEITINH